MRDNISPLEQTCDLNITQDFPVQYPKIIFGSGFLGSYDPDPPQDPLTLMGDSGSSDEDLDEINLSDAIPSARQRDQPTDLPPPVMHLL